METFGLIPLATRRPKAISVGESQRVSIARALANGPKVILADEPTAALDMEGYLSVLEAFNLARTSFGAAIVMASHDVDIRGMAASQYGLRDGVLTRVA